MTMVISDAGSAVVDATLADAVAGLRNTRSECNDIFSEHFISLRVDLSTFSIASSMRGATVQYSSCRSRESGIDRSAVIGSTDELVKTIQKHS